MKYWLILIMKRETVQQYLNDYYKTVIHQKEHFRIFDPKQILLPYKNKVLPESILN